jgi:hypothetical protein
VSTWSIFDDKASTPTEGEVAAALGPSWIQWNELKRCLAAQYAPLTEEWIFGGQKYGWSLRLKHKKRAVLYLTPGAGLFRVGLCLGEKAVRAALASDLPVSVLQLVESAPKYVGGRGIRMEIHHTRDVLAVEKLAAFKMSH